MKKILLAIVAVFMLGAFSASAQKVGHFDYVAVMDTLETYKKAFAQSEELKADFEEQMTAIQEEYQEKAIALQEEGANLPDVIRQNRERELQELGLVAQNIELQYQENAQKIQERYMQPMEDWLKDAVDIVGKREGLSYILYYDESLAFFWYNPEKAAEVTNDIITEMLRLERENPIKEPGQ